MGSVAASRYAGAIDQPTVGLSGPARQAARSSITSALRVASQQPPAAVLAWAAALIVVRYLPARLAHQSAVAAVENVMELGLAGVDESGRVAPAILRRLPERR